jgi:phosphatidylglycerol lysyltransferase
VGFVATGGHVHVVDGLLAAEAHREQLLAEFLAFTAARRLKVCFYNILDDDIDLFERFGFQVSKMGEEPIVRLPDTTWQGKAFEWLRRQENFCLRRGVRMREATGEGEGGAFPVELTARLREISDHYLGRTVHGERIRTFTGRFDLRNFFRRRLFVAELDGRIEAFVVCTPCLEGSMWVMEMFRFMPDAPRGVVPFALLQVMRQMKEEGVLSVSLSLSPCLRCEQPRHGDSPLVRNGMVFWWNHLNWLYDMKGMYHFKSRFRPAFRSMYMAALPRATVFSMVSFLWQWGVIRPYPGRLLHNTLRAWPRPELPNRN